MIFTFSSLITFETIINWYNSCSSWKGRSWSTVLEQPRLHRVWWIYNRPAVAEAVLQSGLFIINLLIHVPTPKSVRSRKLKLKDHSPHLFIQVQQTDFFLIPSLVPKNHQCSPLHTFGYIYNNVYPVVIELFKKIYQKKTKYLVANIIILVLIKSRLSNIRADH